MPEFFTDEYGNTYTLQSRDEVASTYLVQPPAEVVALRAQRPVLTNEQRLELLRESSIDIVTRLRERCAGGGKTRELIAEAGDEIERLRNEVDLLLELCHDLHHDATCAESFCRLCGEGIREWEARRG